jgi:hypothetical protein
LMALTACGSNEKMAEDPSQDSEIQSEPADFEDESLFEADGAEADTAANSDNYDPELGDGESSSAAIDTGEDAQQSFPAPSDEAPPKPDPQPKTATELPEKKQPPVPTPAEKAAMRRLKSDCNMRSKPTVKSEKLKMLTKGKKLWTEPHNEKWFKVYRSKDVAAYVSKACF